VSISVIIPSKTAANFIPCAEAVRKHEPDARIILVDDGVGIEWSDGLTVPGQKPFIFARNCNLGIMAAGDDDVVLLNDDAMLETSEGFSALKKYADNYPEYGMIAPATNVTGAVAQMRQGIGLREVSHIAFVCVYVPRRTLNTVGLLDERFATYGWEDNDMCRRVKRAGLKIGVYDFCFVDHSSLKSTFRGLPNSAGDIEAGRKIFRDKWGDDLT
jgi:GT2 family glycosyltransferase